MAAPQSKIWYIISYNLGDNHSASLKNSGFQNLTSSQTGQKPSILKFLERKREAKHIGQKILTVVFVLEVILIS